MSAGIYGHHMQLFLFISFSRYIIKICCNLQDSTVYCCFQKQVFFKKKYLFCKQIEKTTFHFLSNQWRHIRFVPC
jgi:hypothetical protein